MTFHRRKRRFPQLFNRNRSWTNKRKPNHKGSMLMDQSSSKENLLSNPSQSGLSKSKKLRRSSVSKRHLNTDGTSFNLLYELCKKLPNEATNNEIPSNRKSSPNTKVHRMKNSSIKSIKSEGSSSRDLQNILERLMLEENKHKELKILPDMDNRQEKKFSSKEFTKIPPLHESSISCSSHDDLSDSNRNEEENIGEPAISSIAKFRFEMIDTNEQAKLYVNSRKKTSQLKKKIRRDRRMQRDNNNILISGLEVKQNSVVSVSSCSIDSILENHADEISLHKNPVRRMDRNQHKFDMYSCRASTFTDDIKTAFSDTYGFASVWFGSCIPVDHRK